MYLQFRRLEGPVVSEIPLIKCGKCEVEKPETREHFYYRNGKRHGRTCKPCTNKQQMEYHAANSDQHKAHKRNHNRKLKQQAVEAYGGKCACCGEVHLEFLTLDHVNKDGASHRKSESGNSRYMGSGSYWYRKLRDEGYPNNPPLQVLCFNCNFASFWGVCPHQGEGIK